MKALIIGSKGFIGGHVLQYFKMNQIPVLGCDVVTEYEDEDYVQIDATNSNYHKLFEKNKISICINCSGAASVPLSLNNPLKDFNLNTVNVFKILDAIREYQPDCKFINLSSAAVYGNPTELPIKEKVSFSPISPYGIHKMQAEQICQEFHNFYNIKTCSLRIFSAYGEGLKKQLFWDLFQKFSKNNSIELFGTGNETRDFIYIDDIAQAIYCVVQNADFKGEAINIANGEELSINTIANLFCNEFTREKKKITFNNKVKTGDPLNWRADITILKSFGYEKKNSIEEGIKNYILWAKGNQ
jgi:dTDP-glucose 4,6-dehydratase/UDP-glucose 4-epimerase